MKRFRNIYSILLLLAFMSLGQSCMSIKEYQKIYLNDKDMTLADGKLEAFEANFQTYREGASGANGGKGGGGCGCN